MGDINTPPQQRPPPRPTPRPHACGSSKLKMTEQSWSFCWKRGSRRCALVSRSAGRSLSAAMRWFRTRDDRRRCGVCRGSVTSARGVPSAIAWAATGWRLGAMGWVERLMRYMCAFVSLPPQNPETDQPREHMYVHVRCEAPDVGEMESGTLCGRKPPSSMPPPPAAPTAPPAPWKAVGSVAPSPPAAPAPNPPAPGVATSPFEGPDADPVVAVPPTRFFTCVRMLFMALPVPRCC